MTTNDTFTYKTPYATYTNCRFSVNTYRSTNNKYLDIWDDEGAVCTCSVNGERVNADDEIGIKNWSENRGMDKFLIEMGIIEPTPIATERSGFVEIPYFKLTESGKELFSNK